MNNSCCNQKIDVSCDPCKKCGSCCPANFDCSFDVYSDPYDPRYWWFSVNGCDKRVKLPTFADKPTYIDIDCSAKTFTYYGENETQTFTGDQLGCVLSLDNISDVNAPNPEPCSMLVFNPGCGRCPCTPEEATWQAYTIPDAGDCEVEPDEEGYYHVLVKNDCGCVEECRLPVVAPEAASISYMRDSVPDDPDFPWYYGIYNDTINLHLAENASKYFGLYDLEVTVYYGIQVVKPSVSINMNFRSLVVPVIADSTVNVEKMASILQDDSTFNLSNPSIPWGSKSMRGSFEFIVPKGKEAYLHHEFRLISQASASQIPPQYQRNALDGHIVPDAEASAVDKMVWTASRLNALQIVVKPIRGSSNLDPVVDADRTQLDPPVDEYPGLVN